ncbi:MAG: hypothetical protein JAY90_09805 [Candidatus Thiodiazotropha lotti]|nr:hypothetical protein [Candidatus Thiodiazotropha lotti]ODB99782.1 hypothetical protein A3197_12815 [Candidatus Thiodiazotropha endoloripes]
MKGLRVFTSIALLTAATLSNAAHINHDGKGQIALLPYYTVNNNFITNFTVTNRSEMYKAVRVRLLDSRISADLLNINLYLSPYDTWNATLRKDPASGLPNLITEDESCTYPDKHQLQAGVTFDDSYTANTTEDLTEGYIEIIEMGNIADGQGPALDNDKTTEIDASGSADGLINTATGDRSIPENILPQSNGIPPDCSIVTDAWNAGSTSATAINGFEPGALSVDGIAEDNGTSTEPYDNSQNAGLVAPSGGISAYGIMINIAQGTAFVQQGVHIDGYTSVAQHYLPDDPVTYRLPSLASGNIREAYITNALGDDKKGDTLPLTEYDTGALHDISPLPSVPMGSNPLPIATVLSVESVSAPYFIEQTINGLTDVVLTFPMRKHGIYNGGRLTNQHDPNQAACEGLLNDNIDDGQTVQLTSVSATVHDYPHNGNGEYCANTGFIDNGDSTNRYSHDISLTVDQFDYEADSEQVLLNDNGTPVPIGGEPTPVHILKLGVNVNSFFLTQLNSSNTLFGSPVTNRNLIDLFSGLYKEAGWLKLSFAGNSEYIYDYHLNTSISDLTEVSGGMGAGVANSWTGVPVIGFTAMYSELQSGHLGETVELQRQTNRE